MEPIRKQLVKNALQVWAPDYPRRVNRTQEWLSNIDDATTLLEHAESDPDNRPYISTYSFPDGHTKNGNIPRINTLFIDFDFDKGDYDPENPDISAWRRDISKLLVRVRRVAAFLDESDAVGMRAALSGHKGVHLFVDFPNLSLEDVEFQQCINGMNAYAEAFIDELINETGVTSLRKYVDVTSADLGRLCRVPNTIHGGATEIFGEERYCVPITISELASITPDSYIEYTSSPRTPPESRIENEDVAEILRQHIKTASDGTSRNQGTRSAATIDWSRVEEYKETQNEQITLEDIPLLTSDRPSLWEFYKRNDKYQHGDESHYMEVFCINELLYHNVPVSVIIEFLDSAPEFDEQYSRNRIRTIIAHDYSRFSRQAVKQNAPTFYVE